MNDGRVKGCPNEECKCHKKKKKYKSKEQYCSECGSQLVFVCKSCFGPIEDIDSKHKICLSCEAKRDDKKEKIKKVAKYVGGAVAAAGAVVAAGIVKQVENEVIKQGGKVAKKLVDEAFKKL